MFRVCNIYILSVNPVSLVNCQVPNVRTVPLGFPDTYLRFLTCSGLYFFVLGAKFMWD